MTTKRPDISTLLADACPVCGTTMREQKGKLTSGCSTFIY
jgi:hypothetical protein